MPFLLFHGVVSWKRAEMYGHRKCMVSIQSSPLRVNYVLTLLVILILSLLHSLTCQTSICYKGSQILKKTEPVLFSKKISSFAPCKKCFLERLKIPECSLCLCHIEFLVFINSCAGFTCHDRDHVSTPADSKGHRSHHAQCERPPRGVSRAIINHAFHFQKVLLNSIQG